MESIFFGAVNSSASHSEVQVLNLGNRLSWGHSQSYWL